MTNYKLISFEPTPEMVEAAEEAYMPFGDMDLAIRMAILAAPVVQGEPVYLYRRLGLSNFVTCDFASYTELSGIPNLFETKILYTAPQPLKSSLALDAATHLTNWLNMDLCECEGGHTCGYTDVKRTRDALLVAAEQQPAPDVAGLVEALGCILSMDDEINIVDVMDPKAREMVEIARDALAELEKRNEK